MSIVSVVQDEASKVSVHGILKRDYKYRTQWKARVKKWNETEGRHPFHHGIDMDTHHLISVNAMKDLSDDIKTALKEKGYNINGLGNLVGIPATLEGACHLRTQLHRTKHIFSEDQYGKNKDFDYHKEVRARIKEAAASIRKCYGTSEVEPSKRAIHTQVMDNISQKLLKGIVKFRIPLTSIFNNFNPEDTPYKGCRGVSSIPQALIATQCCDGDHAGESNFRKNGPNELRDSVVDFSHKWELKRTL
ncbi:AHH domain-containing protein [Vibrio profundum]|uniref:AHH domain-containing protein n=1 Tax=Vibrio profundum TaxID=2910247 RepID=UPI003D0AF100